MNHNRREFLSNVGRGMLVASVGPALAYDLGCAPALAEEVSNKITFGELEPLVGLMQDTPVAKLTALLVEKLQAGTVDLKQLTAAAALANARTFGGEDYVGFHSLMALVPAWQMSQQMSGPRAALPVLKVLFRNTDQMQKRGGSKNEVLHPIEAPAITSDEPAGQLLQQATRQRNLAEAERIFAGMSRGPAVDAFSQLQMSVDDEADVHRVVLAARSWSLLDLVGKEHAHTMLRQSVHYCVRSEENRVRNNRPEPVIRTILPKLLDQYKLVGRKPGERVPDNAWIDEFSRTLYNSSPEKAADAVAAALADDISPQAVGEAISLTSNQLVLRDKNARTHGDSLGVHASDATHAWRNIARVTDSRSAAASLIVAAFHTALGGREVIAGSGKQQDNNTYPLADQRAKIEAKDAAGLLKVAEEAIQANDQGRCSAAVWHYGQLALPHEPVFELMLKYAISEDGRLHAEKYYRTVSDEFASTRPAFRWRQLVALARVTASAYGYDRQDQRGHRAPGYEEACRLLKV